MRLRLHNITFVTLTVATLAVWASPLADAFDIRITRPLDFLIRRTLGLDPKLSPKIKILSIDDRAASTMRGGPRLSETTWAKVLANIAAARPAVILVDGMFSLPSENDAELSAAVSRLSALQVPLVAGAFVAKAEIVGRTPYDGTGRNLLWSEVPAGVQPLKDLSPFFAYGPHPTFQTAFARVGNIMSSGNGRVPAVIKTKSGALLPHLAFHAADNIEVAGGVLRLNGVALPEGKDGEVYVNQIAPAELIKANHGILPVVNKTNLGLPVEDVYPGDVVVILPEMFTGSTDFVQTPFGAIPGGYLIVSMVNSVIEGAWLTEVPWLVGVLLILALAAAGAFAGYRMPVRSFFSVLTGTTLLLLGAATLLFSGFGIMSPWAMVLVAFHANALGAFAIKTRQTEKRATAFRLTFEGSLPQDRIDELARNVDAIDFSAREETLSIMFIDIMGFSMTAERMAARAAFDELKVILGQLGKVIHRHGGIVDKILGDGLLCYFGDRLLSTAHPDHHALRAVNAAIEIQKWSLDANLILARAGRGVFPLRAGVNSAVVFIGDLGAGMRIDFTAVGNGVNFAKRMEASSDSHAVLISKRTHDMLAESVEGRKILEDPGTQKTLVQAKHRTELVECYQIDQLSARAAEKREILDAYRRFAGVVRLDVRWTLPQGRQPQLVTSAGTGVLMNFSSSGAQVRLTSRMTKGSKITLMFPKSSEEVKGEVRWSITDTGMDALHGVMFEGLTDAQKDELFQRLYMQLVV